MYDRADVEKLSLYLQEHPKKHLIFDFDDTIMTLQLPWHLYAKGIKEILSEIDPELVALHPGSETKHLITEALAKHGQKARERINPYRRQFEKNCLQGIIRNDFLISFLMENASNYQFSIWSSNDRHTILPQLRVSHLADLFPQVIGADDVGCTKPSPDGFYLLFDPGQDKKADFLFVGDSSSDREASGSVGIDFFLIKRPLRKP